MGIFKALGLGLTIVILQVLVPRLFAGLEDTLLIAFATIQDILANVTGAL